MSTFVNLLKSRLSFILERVSPHYPRMVTYHERVDGNVPDGAVIFIGDSITQGLAVVAVTPLAVNYGIGKDTTVGVLKRVPLYKSLPRAEAIVLTIGVNDLRERSHDEQMSNYGLILEQMLPEVPLIVCAIHPVDERVWVEPEFNARIEAINEALELLCSEYPQSHFVDYGDAFVDDAGQLDSRYHVGDGLHLSTAGYEVWIEALRDALERIRN